MSEINKKLTTILQRVKRPGSFCAAGTASLALPRLKVDGVGPIALPLLPAQAKKLIKASSQAPYGKGEETVVDTKVRKTWQIEADKVHIGGKHWQPMLDAIVDQVKIGLGVTGNVHAELYKMLIYDKGSFFVNHRDTEKSPGMFATLSIALPSVHTGGELRIEHAGQEVLLPLQTDELSEVAFAAFYADCVHEVLPVKTGCRLVLTYNLCYSKRKTLPKPPNVQKEQQQAVSVLQEWAAIDENYSPNPNPNPNPSKLVYLLEHAYTPEGLCFAELKNQDAAIASVLEEAAPQANCEVYLALVCVDESGSAEYHGEGGGRYRRGKRRSWDYDDEDSNNPDDYEVIEVYDENRYIDYWSTPDGSSSKMEALPFAGHELCLPDRLEELEPDEQHFHEATGNEGASFERSYRRAALVLWPKANRAKVIAIAGLSQNLPYLHKQIKRWRKAGSKPQSAYWKNASDLARAIIGHWNSRSELSWSYTHGFDELNDLLEVLIDLQDVVGIEMAIQQIANQEKNFREKYIKTLLKALALLPQKTAIDLVVELVHVHAPVHGTHVASAKLLRCVLATPIGDDVSHFASSAKCLLDNIQLAALDSYSRSRVAPAEYVAHVLAAIGQVDLAAAEQALDQILADSKGYPIKGILIPATLEVADADDCPKAIVARLYTVCLGFLDTELKDPLLPPADWAREVNFKCNVGDKDCREFAKFLRNPKLEALDISASANIRTNVEQTARRGYADVDMLTITKGRPYTLRLTKNQASYDRQFKQRQLDEENRKQLLAKQQLLNKKKK